MKRILFVVMLMLNITLICSSCGGEKSAIEGYEWLEGKWITEYLQGDVAYNCCIITKEYCQYTSFNLDGEVITDVASKPKVPIVIEISYNQYLESDCKTFADGMYYIDENKQQIYWLYDFDQKVYMKKIE